MSRTLTRHAIPHRQFSAFMYRAMLNLTDPSPDDVSDRVVNAMSQLTPR